MTPGLAGSLKFGQPLFHGLVFSLENKFNRHSRSVGNRSRHASHRVPIVGLILTGPPERRIADPEWGEFLCGASDACLHLGFQLRLVGAAGKAPDQLSLRLLERDACDGYILFGGTTCNAPTLEAWPEDFSTPVVLFGVPPGRTSKLQALLEIDHEAALRQAFDYLDALGHHRLSAFFSGRSAEAFRDHSPSDLDVEVHADVLTERQAFRRAMVLLETSPPPTAFLTSSPILAIGIRRALEGCGLTLGRDVSIITFDPSISMLGGTDMAPAFTCIRYSAQEAGSRSVELFAALLSSRHEDTLFDTMTPKLVIGPSTGPLLGKKSHEH
uniref:Transcriptional regulator LacI/GalR-like sensor domain-containing protein n=1 Tax=Alloyangia mangrovi TaxID=1779329 RepID=A0A2A3K045_9RHOB